jgi:cbb3-type cytochrome oxidase subunit 3
MEFFINNAATIATISFFLAFCCIFYFTFKKSNKKKFEKYSKIPLKDKD